jgi:hypothetical protein
MALCVAGLLGARDGIYPQFNAGGLSSLFAVLMAGGRHIFPSRFTAAAMIDDLDRHQVS